MKSFVKQIISSVSPRLFRRLKRFNYEKNVLPKEFVIHMNRLKKGDLVIDVGANIGLVTESLALRGATVISLEPNSEAFLKLKEVELRYENIDARQEAAGTEDKNVKLYLHKSSLGSESDFTQASSLLSKKPNVSEELYEEIKEIDFALLIKSLKSSVELIKIDIEGYEIDLINHLLDMKVLDKVKKIYVETHERKFNALLEETEKLKRRVVDEGYEEKFFFDWH